jgi:hypothetical protein
MQLLCNIATPPASILGRFPVKPFGCGLQVVNPLEVGEWDRLLAARADGTVFHASGWARVLREVFNFTPCYLADVCGDRMEALLPMMEVKSVLTGIRGVALPFADGCEPLGDDRRGAKLIQSALEYGAARKWRYFECRGGRQYMRDVPVSLGFYTHLLDLTQGVQRLWDGLEGSVRRAVRKAQEQGIQILVSRTLDSAREFYRLYCLTRKRHGLPPQSWRFFESIHRHILSAGHGFMVEAWHDGRVVASNIYFHQGKKAVYKYGASDTKIQNLRASNLVMWQAIETLVREGFSQLDLGRTSLGNAGLRRFKLGWGVREAQLEYFKYNFRSGKYVADQDKTLGWHVRLFRLIPSALARPIGTLLYRHLA